MKKRPELVCLAITMILALGVAMVLPSLAQTPGYPRAVTPKKQEEIIANAAKKTSQENCEQYYTKAIEQANAAEIYKRPWTDSTGGIKEGLTSLSYSAIYQNCLARNKR